MSSQKPLGQLLVSRGLIAPRALGEALAAQRGTGRRLASELRARGAVDEGRLVRCLAMQVGVPGVDLSRLVLPLRFLDVLQQGEALRRKVLPIWVDGERIFVAAADPHLPDFEAELAFLSRKQVVITVALDEPLGQLTGRAYEAKKRGELELRGSLAEGPAREPELVSPDEVTYVPVELLPPASVVQASEEEQQQRGEGAETVPRIEIDLSGDDQAGDLAVASTPDLTAVLGGEQVLTAEPADERDSGARALVVDDDVELARLIERTLTTRGVRCSVAHRGLAALAALKASPPDLVVLDAMLPELHGFDIVQKIKGSERYRHIPVVMMSSVYRGWRIAEDLKESYGVEAFLEKPFGIDVLWSTVDRVLSASKRPGRRRRMPSSAQRAYRNSMERFRAEDLEGAIVALKQAIATDPLTAKLHFQLGVLYLKKRGMVYQAMQSFEEAVQLDPGYFPALRSLAILYQRKGFRNKAVDMWERALRCSPDQQTAEQMRKHLINLL